ncbi:hypothetical protein MKX01_031777 [Papaver californicum]|nr:hypothetical protein MKX01_031777 [Papaver californicum]
MASEIFHQHQLHVFIFPVTAQGRMIPMINISKLFAARGVKITIITAPLNAVTLSKTIDHDRLSGLDINIQTIPFPAVEVGLPEGMESVNQITSSDMMPKFFMAVNMLQQPFEKLLEVYHPDFIVADMFLPWMTEAVAKFGIPRLIFHGTDIFSQCVAESLRVNKPFERIMNDKGKGSFFVSGLPDKIEMTMSQVPEYIIGSDSLHSVVMEKVRESEQKSYGHMLTYKNAMGIRAWKIGPLSLQNNDTLDNIQRKNISSFEEHSILDWLDSKQPNSVIYVSFSSMSKLSSSQFTEIATGLEDSRCSFIWVVRKTTTENENLFPEGFEERMEGKGLIIREWAPQVLILDHLAVGGFMTHSEEWKDWVETANVSVKKEKIAKAVSQLMSDDGEENKEMRKRVTELSEKAKRSVKEDGFPKMGSEAPPHPHQLHGFFFPLMAYGHMIPMFDVARMFAARDRSSGLDIDIQILRFPTEEAGLTEGCENVNNIDAPEMIPNFFQAVNMLQEPLEQLLEEYHPDFIVADMFFHWATESEDKLGIPRCYSLNLYEPYEDIAVDTEAFMVTDLPDKIEMTLQVPDHFKLDTPFTEMIYKIRDSEIKSYGVLVNSFYELEPAYADHYRNIMGRRAWKIGPVSLRNRNTVDKAQRGKQSATTRKTAMALEDSSVSFVWVIRTTGNNKDERFLPEGYKERIEGKGMIIKEWVPQVLILDHPSVGGVSAGVPLITWPLFVEQYHNENLVTQVLKTGIGLELGNATMVRNKRSIGAERKDREGPEGNSTMRIKAKELGEMARKAVEDGGSSYTKFTCLIEELKISRKAST